MLGRSLLFRRVPSVRLSTGSTRYAGNNFANSSNAGRGYPTQFPPPNSNASFLHDPLFGAEEVDNAPVRAQAANASHATTDKNGILAFPEEEGHSYRLPSRFDRLDDEDGGEDGAGPLLDERALAALAAPVDDSLVEIKPDGAIYLPEVHYRRVLTQAFGPLGWLLWPRGPHTLLAGGTVLTREYVLVCKGRVVATARGSATLHAHTNAAQATESVKSNALMRTCKDLGIASELWDARYVAQWRERFATRRQLPNSNKMVFVKKD